MFSNGRQAQKLDLLLAVPYCYDPAQGKQQKQVYCKLKLTKSIEWWLIAKLPILAAQSVSLKLVRLFKASHQVPGNKGKQRK